MCWILSLMRSRSRPLKIYGCFQAITLDICVACSLYIAIWCFYVWKNPIDINRNDFTSIYCMFVIFGQFVLILEGKNPSNFDVSDINVTAATNIFLFCFQAITFVLYVACSL